MGFTTRTNDEDNDLTKLLGFKSCLDVILSEAVTPGDLADINSSKSTKGGGTVARDEVITLTVAAIVTQVLPNGNLVLRGRQKIRVNFKVRELWITGVVRPEDISSTNTIDYSKMAEAHVVYGSRGVLTDMQQPRYGVQLFDIIYPFEKSGSAPKRVTGRRSVSPAGSICKQRVAIRHGGFFRGARATPAPRC